MSTLKIRDGFAELNGDKTAYDMPSGSLEIIADDGRQLVSIGLLEGGAVRVSVSGIVKHEGVVLGSTLLVKPGASNVVEIRRLKYK